MHNINIPFPSTSNFSNARFIARSVDAILCPTRVQCFDLNKEKLQELQSHRYFNSFQILSLCN